MQTERLKFDRECFESDSDFKEKQLILQDQLRMDEKNKIYSAFILDLIKTGMAYEEANEIALKVFNKV